MVVPIRVYRSESAARPRPSFRPFARLGLIAAAFSAACATAEPDPPCAPPALLFGAPNAATGLDAASCAPECEFCESGPWVQPTYTSLDFSTWRAWTLLDPPRAPATDPYEEPPPAAPSAEAVCAMVPEGGGYRLRDFPSSADAVEAGGSVTHFGRCGLCSTLADLAVYASTPDLTEPVRSCGLENLGGDHASLAACIAALGFTEPCASIWAYNTQHTRQRCLSHCLEAIDAPYNEADGSLNPCLQCDEDESGAVFSAIAGRTRRNTGLASSICRPCSEVRPLEHRYGEPPGQ